MSLVTFPILLAVFMVGTASLAWAAGGGGSAGGAGAQNAIASGRSMSDGQRGPAGSPNNPRPKNGATETYNQIHARSETVAH